MSDRVDPITEEKESEVKAQDLQEDAAEKEETQEVLKTDALAEIPADEIPDEDFLAEPAEDEIVTEEESQLLASSDSVMAVAVSSS